MNKKFLVVLAGLTALSLSSCNKKDSTSPNSTTSKPSNSISSSSTSSVNQEQLDEGKAYLETSKKSVCKVDTLFNEFTQYCTDGEMNITINHAQRNKKNNFGDISIMQYNQINHIALADPISHYPGETDNFPQEESNSVYRDWKLNHCSLDGADTTLCNSVNVDEGNGWVWRIMVDGEGKISAMYPAGTNYASPAEPYFSDFTYNAKSNNNMFFSYTRDFDTPNDGLDTDRGFDEKHLLTWAIANPKAGNDENGVPYRYSTGFNILEHADHSMGRHQTYWFEDASEKDVMSWAFLGANPNGDVAWGLKKHTKRRTVYNVNDNFVDNEETVYSLVDVAYSIEMDQLYIPGQFDDVRIKYQENQGVAGEYTLTETFEYDPYNVYLKFKKYADYLAECYLAADGQTDSTADILFESLDFMAEDTLNKIYILNSNEYRASEDKMLVGTQIAEETLDAYKATLIALANSLEV